MSSLNNRIGNKYGRLTVVSRAENTLSGKSKWLCVCDCGNHTNVRGSDLATGGVRSCGCIKKEVAARKGRARVTHGDSGTRLYRIWQGMKQRATYKNGGAYKHYGGRGVTVCDEWANSYAEFKNWSADHGYLDNLTIDRIDNNKGYSPDNCKWSTYKQQENNRRNNRKITVAGETHTVSEWSEISEISGATLCYRLNNGWPKEDLFMPANLNNKNIRKEIAQCQ